MISSAPNRTAKALAIELLPTLNHDKVMDYSRWVRSIANPIDYGFLNEQGEKRRYSDERIDEHFWCLEESKAAKNQGIKPMFFGAKRINPLSLTKIVLHLSGQQTYYYVSDYQSGTSLLMFDFDWKSEHCAKFGEHTDAKSAALFIAHALELPDTSYYVEPSLNGYGSSLFLLVDTNYIAKQRIVDVCKSVAVVFSVMIEQEGYLCSFDMVSGSPSMKERRGDLARIPRPKTNAEIDRLLNLKPQAFALLENLTVTTPLPSTESILGGRFESPSSSEKSCSNDNPPIRMNLLVAELFRTLNRVPTLVEVLTEYETRNLHTGPDQDGNREKLAVDAINYFAGTFVPSYKNQDCLQHLPLIQSLISAEAVRIAYNARPLLHEDIAVCYFLMRCKGTGGAEIAIPKTFLLNGSRALKANGQYGRVLDNKKIAACKQLLEAAGLIIRLRKGKKGKGCDVFKIGEIR